MSLEASMNEALGEQGGEAPSEQVSQAPFEQASETPEARDSGRAHSQDQAAEVSRELGTDVGLSLLFATLFGGACIVRTGTWESLVAAGLVPVILLATAIASVPSLAIGLALAGGTIDAKRAVKSAALGIVSAGRILGGLTPLVLLYRATSVTAILPLVLGTAVVALAALFGLAHLIREFARATDMVRTRALTLIVSVSGFSVFALALGLRLWVALVGALFFGESLHSVFAAGGAS